MIIIAGHVLVEPSERDAYVETLRDLVARARDFPGCIHLAVTADSLDPARVVNAEVWADVEALDAWRAQADAPDVPEPRSVEVSRYDATDGGPLFP